MAGAPIAMIDLSAPGMQWLVYALVFCSAALALQTIAGSGRQAAKTVKQANERLRVMVAGGDTPQTQVLAKLRRDRGLSQTGDWDAFNHRIAELVTQSGVRFGAHWVYVAMPGCAAVLALLGLILFKSVFAFGMGLVAGPLVPILVLKFLVGRRRKKAVAQLPEAIDVIVRSLGAGHPVPVAMALVGQEMPDPVGTEFGMASDEISFGSSVGAAVQRLAERIGHEDYELFSAMIRLQERTGGNLAELLRANAKTIRDRQKMRLKIKAASAEGRMSAMILNAAPILLFLAINVMSPEFYGEVIDHPIIMPAAIGVIIWMIIGNLVMRKMINFKI